MIGEIKLCARQRHMDGVMKLDWSKIGSNIKRTIKQLLFVLIYSVILVFVFTKYKRTQKNSKFDWLRFDN